MSWPDGYEHLAQHAEGVVRFGRLIGLLLDPPGDVGPLHVLHLLRADHRDDAAVDDRPIASLVLGLLRILEWSSMNFLHNASTVVNIGRKRTPNSPCATQAGAH